MLSVLRPIYRDKPATGRLLSGWVRGVLATAQALGQVDVSFRTWTAERSRATRDVAEMALAQVVSRAVERSYARSELFDQRRGLMDRWAAFVTGPVLTR